MRRSDTGRRSRVLPARIGVIGCGWWATRAHLPALARNPAAVIAAIVDPDDGNRSRAAERFDVPEERAFADAADMYAAIELDGAIVAVPHALHAGVATGALDRGLHVLLEKPMTIRSDDAKELHELAVARGVELIIGYPWHYNAHATSLREVVRSGELGRLELIAAQYVAKARALYRGRPGELEAELGYPVHGPASDTYADPEIAGGGQGMTQTTHALALMLWLTEARAISLFALTEAHELEVDLVDGLLIRFEGGAIGTLASSGSLVRAEHERMELRVYGDEGHAIMDLSAGRAGVVSRHGTRDLEILPQQQRAPEGAPADNLVDVILGRDANRSPGELGWRTVALVEAMYRSSREARMIELDRGRQAWDPGTDAPGSLV